MSPLSPQHPLIISFFIQNNAGFFFLTFQAGHSLDPIYLFQMYLLPFLPDRPNTWFLKCCSFAHAYKLNSQRTLWNHLLNKPPTLTIDFVHMNYNFLDLK